MQIPIKQNDLYFPFVNGNGTHYFIDHQNGHNEDKVATRHHEDKVATINVARKLDICRRRSNTFLL